MFTIACPISGSSRQTGEEEQRASRLAAEEEEVKMVTDRQAGWMTGADDGDLVVDVDGWWKDSLLERQLGYQQEQGYYYHVNNYMAD
ncbi:hypothetical protein A7C99_5308 [Trichophyton rubrum]|uniref:Uncharacterized protein n=1 Tax=Trichophyton rubrum TaxID=5551 RepID=A0A178EU87_TRIRU|nr:hypothetical protein A7C99_5308 [Trichophyton rubrum]